MVSKLAKYMLLLTTVVFLDWGYILLITFNFSSPFHL